MLLKHILEVKEEFVGGIGLHLLPDLEIESAVGLTAQEDVDYFLAIE